MKRSIIILLILFITSCTVVKSTKYEITFNVNGGSNIDAQFVVENGLIVEPDTPIKDNYVFLYWYATHYMEPYDFAKKTTKNLTLNAFWQDQASYDLHQTLLKNVDYDSMGFSQRFDESIAYTSWEHSIDGSIDPLFGKTIEYVKDARPDRYSEVDPFWAYFDEELYTIYERWNYSQNAWFFTDILRVDDTWKLQFFADGIEPYTTMSHRPGPFIDGIESNGYYSYVLNRVYNDKTANTKFKDAYFRLFYAIYHDNDFPYIVFFNDSYMFLINKIVHFDQSILFDLASNEDITFFK